MRVLNYGLGTNSTALAIEATRRGIIFDLVVAADTGDERQHSYRYSKLFSKWLVRGGQPPITWVKWIRKDGSFVPLSQFSLRTRTLPSKAYGLSGCTSKWKQQPIDGYLRHNAQAVKAHQAGELIERWIGYDADEPERSVRMLDKDPQPVRQKTRKIVKPDGTIERIKEVIKIPWWKWMCPLVDWDMGREECIESIKAAGLPLPGKSSCVMCPSTKKHEILTMAREEPEEMAKALLVEDTARASGELRTVKGLGRSFSWREFLEGSGEAIAAREVVEQECGCFDGT